MATEKTPKVTTQFVQFGNAGLSAAIVDGALFVRIPISGDAIASARASTSGKTRLLANSGGWTTLGLSGLPDGLRLNVMASVPAVTIPG